ncbi:unnamed protein product [Rotaria sordida]|uniref:Uncharacterized protein n=1 Tax=Rotaria sordida TaxID=392033 RepID=A0A815ETG3_9BILA|nr:unnamed protein product [Rotaria sordida]CAF1583363.1 unnamed protein product [Rotaria sordida]
MKVIIALCVLFIGAYCVPVTDEQPENDWASFKRVYKKQYKSTKEDADRENIWKVNRAIIEEHNRKASLGQYTFTLGMNKFGDLTLEEFTKKMNGFKMSTKTDTSQSVHQTFVAPTSLTLTNTVDWSPQGCVAPVKDQGQCGSCWAFSAIGSLESQKCIKTGNLVRLSEQNLVDCSDAYGNQGCNGGWMNSAFQYIIDNNGVDTEASYPYTATDNGPCSFQASNVGATVTGFVNIKPGSEADLQAAIATIGPISVAINAGLSSFHFYKSGVYNDPRCKSTPLNHAVLAFGFNKTASQPYYIVKNSWGTSWGKNGHIWMTLGTKNQCGIASAASYPLV